MSKIGWGVVIDENCNIGNDVFIGHNTVIRSGVKIGEGSIIGHLVMVESDTVIGGKGNDSEPMPYYKICKYRGSCFHGAHGDVHKHQKYFTRQGI